MTAKFSKKTPTTAQIIFFVTLLHIVFIASITQQKKRPIQNQPLIVTTTTVEKKQPPPPLQQLSPKKPKAKPEKKKKQEKQQIAKPLKEPKKSSLKKDLVQKALKELDTIGKNHSDLPPQLAKTRTLSFATTSTSKYESSLATYLKKSLCLPEHGSVQLSITLDRKGLLKEIKVLLSPSSTNKQYVEKQLAQAHFPPFGPAFPGEKEHSFTLLLSSE